MATVTQLFKTVDNNFQDLSSGRIYNVYGTIEFLTGETAKYLQLSIPVGVSLSMVTMGIKFKDTFDNTVNVDLFEQPAGLTNVTPLTAENMNRNYFATPFPTLFDIFTTTGSMTSYGDWIDNFKVVDRNLQQQVASNYGIHQLQRIKGSTIDYAYRISRAADTATLTLDINFIVVQTV